MQVQREPSGLRQDRTMDWLLQLQCIPCYDTTFALDPQPLSAESRPPTPDQPRRAPAPPATVPVTNAPTPGMQPGITPGTIVCPPSECRRAPQWSGSKAMILDSFQPTTHNLSIMVRGKLSSTSCSTGTLPTSTTCFCCGAYWKVGSNRPTSLLE